MNKKILLGVLLLLMLSKALNALEVEQVFWGFNGKAVKNKINPVSIQLVNPLPNAYEGNIKLVRLSPGETQVGAPLVRQLYIGPFSKKWLQFYTYNMEPYEEWRLIWGKGPNDSMILPLAKFDAPAVVALRSSKNMFYPVKMPCFVENLFPTCVAATSGLNAIILDHNPRLTVPQREALLDWIRKGGIVHIVPGPDGIFPKFAENLSALNSPLEKFYLGSGQVVRHNINPREMNAKYLRKIGYPCPQLEKGKNEFYWDINREYFRKLRKLVKTKHDWTIIYLGVILYIILVGPINYLVGRKVRNYLVPIFFFLGIVTFFALVFSYVGRRGYGEKTVINDFTYAHCLGDGNYDVKQWLNAFVTDGDYYNITHPGKYHFYSACQQQERVNGIIHNGPNGSFNVDIPMFSSRWMLHEAKMRAPAIKPQILSCEGKDRLSKLSVKINKDIKLCSSGSIWAVYGNKIYKMHNVKNCLILHGPGLNQNQFVNNQPKSFRMFGHHHNYNEASDKVFQIIAPVQVLNSLGWTPQWREYTFNQTKRDRNLVKIFMLAHTPKEFCCNNKNFTNQKGYTLFHFDLELEK